jgi:hypothetical protein
MLVAVLGTRLATFEGILTGTLPNETIVGNAGGGRWKDSLRGESVADALVWGD